MIVPYDIKEVTTPFGETFRYVSIIPPEIVRVGDWSRGQSIRQFKPEPVVGKWLLDVSTSPSVLGPVFDIITLNAYEFNLPVWFDYQPISNDGNVIVRTGYNIQFRALHYAEEQPKEAPAELMALLNEEAGKYRYTPSSWLLWHHPIYEKGKPNE